MAKGADGFSSKAEEIESVQLGVRNMKGSEPDSQFIVSLINVANRKAAEDFALTLEQLITGLEAIE